MEFEPKKKEKEIKFNFKFNKMFIRYMGCVALVLFLGITYGHTFFINKLQIGTGRLHLDQLIFNLTGDTISLNNLAKKSDKEGLLLTPNEITITNTGEINGHIKLKLERTSGIGLNNLRYALIINDNIVDINDVPSNGVFFESEVLDSEVINLKLKLFIKNSYTGNETTFNGTVTKEILRDEMLAAKFLEYKSGFSRNNITKEGDNYYYNNGANNNYVWFNCDKGYTSGVTHCSKYRIVGVEDDQIVVTNDLNNAKQRVNSNLYTNILGENKDNSLIKSISTDNKNFYLKKSAISVEGDGTEGNPYVFGLKIESVQDKKVKGVITYKDGNNTVGTQYIYTDETNYILQVLNAPGFIFVSWSDGTNDYDLGDTVNFTTNTILTAKKKVNAVNVSFVNTVTGFDCADLQCAIEEIDRLVG